MNLIQMTLAFAASFVFVYMSARLICLAYFTERTAYMNRILEMLKERENHNGKEVKR